VKRGAGGEIEKRRDVGKEKIAGRKEEEVGRNGGGYIRVERDEGESGQGRRRDKRGGGGETEINSEGGRK